MRRSHLHGFAMCIELLRKEPQTVMSLTEMMDVKHETVRRHLRVLESFEFARRLKVPGQAAERWEWLL